jgi:hypothetical protein
MQQHIHTDDLLYCSVNVLSHLCTVYCDAPTRLAAFFVSAFVLGWSTLDSFVTKMQPVTAVAAALFGKLPHVTMQCTAVTAHYDTVVHIS